MLFVADIEGPPDPFWQVIIYVIVPVPPGVSVPDPPLADLDPDQFPPEEEVAVQIVASETVQVNVVLWVRSIVDGAALRVTLGFFRHTAPFNVYPPLHVHAVHFVLVLQAVSV